MLKKLNKIIVSILLVFSIYIFSFLNVFALGGVPDPKKVNSNFKELNYEKVTSDDGYSIWVFHDTNYDFSKKYDVQTVYNKGEDAQLESLSKLYQTFRAWGISKEGSAAICGNIGVESQGDPSRISWNFDDWGDLFKKYGDTYGMLTNDYIECGLGLIGFTDPSWIHLLACIAADKGLTIGDLSVQLSALNYSYGPKAEESTGEKLVDDNMLKYFYNEYNISYIKSDKNYIKSDSNVSLLEHLRSKTYYMLENYISFDTGDEVIDKINMLTCLFQVDHERPANYSGGMCAERCEWANKIYEKYKDLEPYDYGEDKAGVAQNPSDNDNSDGSSNNGSRVDLSGIVSEWDLTGMPSQSGLVEDLVNPHLADSSDIEKDFTVKQLYSIHEINKSKELQNEFDAWTKARVVIVFFGLLFIVYAILLMLALMFDKVNNIFDFSLLSIFTLGKIQYSNDILVKEEKSKFATGKRVIISIVVLFVVGCIFISGGVLPAVMKGIYNVYNGVGSLFSGG